MFDKTIYIKKKYNLRKIADRFLGIPLVHLLSIIKQQKIGIEEIDKIVALKFYGLGDFILSTPALKVLSEKKLHVVVSPTILEAAEMYPFIKSVSVFTEDLNGFRRNINKFKNVDCVIDFELFSRISALLTLLIRPKYSIGFDSPSQKRGIAYTHPVKYPEYDHVAKAFLKLVEPFGKGELILPKPRIKRYPHLKIGKNTIGIHPTCGKSAKSRMWPIERWIALVKSLEEEGYEVVMKDEDPYITAKIKEETDIMSLKFSSLHEFAYVISQCKAFISIDTGPMHLAAALQVPTVGLFGPNTPQRWGPLCKKCVAVYKPTSCSPCILVHKGIVPECRDNICMKNIQVKDVINALHSVLS